MIIPKPIKMIAWPSLSQTQKPKKMYPFFQWKMDRFRASNSHFWGYWYVIHYYNNIVTVNDIKLVSNVSKLFKREDRDTIKATWCDTTNSNLGSKNFAETLLIRNLSQNYLYLPCRHHIFQVVFGEVFDFLISAASTGPSIQHFNWFRNHWQKIVLEKFSSI